MQEEPRGPGPGSTGPTQPGRHRSRAHPGLPGPLTNRVFLRPTSLHETCRHEARPSLWAAQGNGRVPSPTRGTHLCPCPCAPSPTTQLPAPFFSPQGPRSSLSPDSRPEHPPGLCPCHFPQHRDQACCHFPPACSSLCNLTLSRTDMPSRRSGCPEVNMTPHSPELAPQPPTPL